MSESTPTEDPDGPEWRTLGEREVIQPGDMWKDIDGNWRETKYGPKTRCRVTAADYYRRRIETPEPTRVEIPADSKMNEVNVMRDGMTYLQDSITAWAIRKGWLTETPRNPAEQLMLIVTELAEACEAFRVGNPPCERPGMEQYSHAAEELADVVIRCFQMAGEHDIPLADVVLAKMAFNETRPVKHGKQF